jgi:hypothetical protein
MKKFDWEDAHPAVDAGEVTAGPVWPDREADEKLLHELVERAAAPGLSEPEREALQVQIEALSLFLRV